MTQPHHNFWRALAACAVFAAGAAAAQDSPPSTDSNVPPATAQKQAREIAQGGPGRWEREDVTMAQRLRTIRKEIGAALQEQQGACRKLRSTERPACMAEARSTYQHDMAGARDQAMASQP